MPDASVIDFPAGTPAAPGPDPAGPAPSGRAPTGADPAALVHGHFAGADRLDMAPYNEIITCTTRLYLDSLDPAAPPSPRVLEARLLALVNQAIDLANDRARRSTEKYPCARSLTHWQVAQILLRLHHVIRIAPSTADTDRDYDLLAMYCDTGRARGTYTTSEDDIRTSARRYHTALTVKEFVEVIAVLREDAPRRHQCLHRDLVAVGNGVFHYGTEPADLIVAGRAFHFTPKTLHPFDPALTFLAKCHVDYVANPPNPVIDQPDGTPWDVVSWLEDLFRDADDPEFTQRHQGLAALVWEIIGAIIRPHVSWGKTAWFYSEQGNNGKGTICRLLRNLCGPGAHTSIPLADFGKEFALEPLIRASAIIVDENDVGTFIDQAANLKALVTNDPIQINRKYRMPVTFQFWGLMVQCLNEFPRVKDKSESFYRRQLFVPFTRSFTGRERPAIKEDYLQRREVLEYVLWHALHRAGASTPGRFYRFSEPPATRAVLAEYKETNDPVRAFWAEFRDRFVWDLLPFTFLYELYKAWFAEMSPKGSPVSHKQFVTDLVAIVRADDQWHCPDKNRKIRPGRHMARPELLIAEYELTKWLNPHYASPGQDPRKRSQPVLQANYRGLLRHPGRPPQAPGAAPGPGTDRPGRGEAGEATPPR